MPDVKVPVLGSMNRTTVLMGGVTAVVVAGYLVFKHAKESKAVATTRGGSYGYGASAYGYGAGVPQGYYGYGYGYGGFGPGDFTPYPTGSEYGYGAYGYGYYNPYTGQWIGPGGTTPPTSTGTSTGTTTTTYPELPNPTRAQELKAYAAGRLPGELGLIFTGGKWYRVPPPTNPTGPTTRTITAGGSQTLAATGRANGISEFQLLAYNPNLAYLYGSKKPIPRGTRVKV
jgi:hypothetical protein